MCADGTDAALSLTHSNQSIARYQVAAEAIKRSLDVLKGAPRTQFGLITFNSEVHFYDLSGGSTGNAAPRILVMTDLNDVFRPIAEDLLVELGERREAIDTLLSSLSQIHALSPPHEDAALGPALEAAFDAMAHVRVSSSSHSLLLSRARRPKTNQNN